MLLDSNVIETSRRAGPGNFKAGHLLKHISDQETKEIRENLDGFVRAIREKKGGGQYLKTLVVDFCKEHQPDTAESRHTFLQFKYAQIDANYYKLDALRDKPPKLAKPYKTVIKEEEAEVDTPWRRPPKAPELGNVHTPVAQGKERVNDFFLNTRSLIRSHD